MQFLLRVAWLLTALGCSSAEAVAARPSRPSPLPNFLIVLADGLRPDDLDSPTVPTPALDQLKTQGMQFSQAYAGSPANAASRAALMTGQHAGRNRVRSDIQTPLALEDVTLAEVLRTVGYRSGFMGVWGLGWENTSGHPNKQGFDEFFGCLDLVHGRDEQTAFLWRSNIPFLLKGHPSAQGASAFDWLMRGATNFVRINEDRPFLMVFAPLLPGIGLTTNLAQIPTQFHPTHFSGTPSERARAARLGLLDQLVSRLMADLKKRKLDTDTLVIVTSTAPGTTALGKASQGELSEAALRVPLLAWWPGKVAPGATNRHPVAAWDILPTMAQLARAPTPATLNGRSFSAWLLGQTGPTNPPSLYWESHADGSGQAARLGDWKAVRRGNPASLQLYNLGSDPDESRDLAAGHPEQKAQFERFFAENFRPWTPPADGAAVAAGRPSFPVPTNLLAKPLPTNALIKNSDVP